MTTEQPKLTRRQAIEFLHKHGFPIGAGTFNRLCSPAYGEGPPIAGWWGNRALYEPADLLAWANSRVRAESGPIAGTKGSRKGATTHDHVRSEAAIPERQAVEAPRRLGAVHEHRQPRCRSTE